MLSATVKGTLFSVSVIFLALWMYETHSFEEDEKKNGADSFDKQNFKFNWLVKNYPYCRQKKCEPLSSPVFSVGDSAWRLRLDSRVEADGNHYLALFLVREIDDKGPDSIEVEFEALIFSQPPPSPASVHKSITYSFRRGSGYGWPKFANPLDVWRQDTENPFAPGPRLDIRSTLRISKSLFPFTQSYVAVTSIEVNVISFTWTVERFSAFLPGEMKSMRTAPGLPVDPWMSLALYVTDAIPSEVKVQIQVIQPNKQVKCSACNVSLVDENEKHWMSFHDAFVGNTLWEFPLFLTKDKLLMEKKLYLPNDELSLKFHCVISTGINYERIVAWHSEDIRSM